MAGALGMEMRMVAMVLFMVLSLLAGSCDAFGIGEVYKVGDDDGWTVKPNYTYWTKAKNFKVGDIIYNTNPINASILLHVCKLVFQYDPKNHNVIEVKSLADYRKCNTSSGIVTHTSGNDSILIKTPGHRYFICGFQGHCPAGQRVDIRVLKQSSTFAPSPSAMPPANSNSLDSIFHGPPAAAPKVSGGSINEVMMLLVVLPLFHQSLVSVWF
ncbi:hypothetical protein J5N97_010560 [Dioscorea zingiberensis]|uniref:Phytocyanin domain-containing protein n=1 Tax=Dioscorea zingiberensis TaxID=325984 RepID=A0A9D5HMI8_9LILI|nr:hypothetical protein J5N97_010560 [Dioscorea zingiberensis]